MTATPPLGTDQRPHPLLLWSSAVLVVAVTVHELRYQGRVWWCAGGGWNLWSSDAWGPHNSQHLFDPYSLTHVLHGMLLWGILAWIAPGLDRAWRLWIAFVAESAWEMFENTRFVIDRYRDTTAALGYEGDSVANSLGDVLTCVVGYLLADRIGPWKSFAVVVGTELVLLLWIRDNLFLNIVMLVSPVESIHAWQLGH